MSLEKRKEKIPTLLILSAEAFHVVERKDKEKRIFLILLF
jgi:hypothetical protein